MEVDEEADAMQRAALEAAWTVFEEGDAAAFLTFFTEDFTVTSYGEPAPWTPATIGEVYLNWVNLKVGKFCGKKKTNTDHIFLSNCSVISKRSGALMKTHCKKEE